MKKIISIFLCGLIIGCTSSHEADKLSNLPVLVEQEVLPALPPSISIAELKIVVRMEIDEKGEVAQAHFLEGSGETEWDSLALQSIKKWKFDPARFDDKPVKRWIVQRATVKSEKPFFISLAEIVCETNEKANKVLAILKECKDFSQLAKEVPLEPSKNESVVLGKIDVNKFPSRISSVLKKLGVGQFTSPIEYNKQFVIFKRMQN
jgi:TonB family protein